MPNSINTGTKDIPLKFSKELTKIVNEAWNNGSFIKRVTPTTKELLKFWDIWFFVFIRYCQKLRFFYISMINYNKGLSRKQQVK